MIIFNAHEKEQINNGTKVSTLRAIRPSGKGYFKIRSLQMFCCGRDFKNGIFNRGLILARYPVEIPQLTAEDFQALGYKSKAEYMEQPYNQTNPSPYRMKYDFITLSELLKVKDPRPVVKDCRELTGETVEEVRAKIRGLLL